MALKDHKDFLATIGALVQIVAIAGGGAFGLYEYLQKEKADHIKDSLAYVDHYHKAPIFDVRAKLDRIWADKEEELVAKLKTSENEYEKLILMTVRDQHLESEIFSLISFYETVDSCSRAKICDSETIKTFFCSDARSFFRLHFRFIKYERSKRNDPSLGQALERFANKECHGG